MADEPITMTRAEYEAAYGAIPTPTATPIPMTRAEYAATYGEKSLADKVNAAVIGAGQFAKGGAFGFADEASAVAGAVGNKLLDKVFGTDLTGNMDLGQAYDAYLSQIRGEDKAFETANPWSSVAMQGTGAAVSPISKILAPAKALTIGNLITSGAAGGALYGAGDSEGGIKNRAIGAGVGGVVGGGTGGLIGALGAGAQRLGTPAWGWLKERLGRVFPEPEAGKLSITGGQDVSPKITPEQAHLLDRLQTQSPEELKAASIELGSAIAENSPITLAEALQNPSASRFTRFLANKDVTMKSVSDFTKARSGAAGLRIKDALDSVSPNNTTYNLGEALRAGAEKTRSAIAEERAAAVKPLFDEAMSVAPLRSTDLHTLWENPIVKPMVQASREIVAAGRKVPVGDVDPFSAEVTQDVLSRVSTKIDNAYKSEASDSARVANDWKVIYARLKESIYPENPALKTARDAYRVITSEIKDPTDKQIRFLTKIGDNQLPDAGKELIGMPPEQITKLKDAFEQYGHGQEFKDGVRAYFQKILEETTGGAKNKNVVDRMIGSTEKRQAIEAALGKKEADALFGKLAREETIFEGTQALHPGSSTAGNLAEEAEFSNRVTGLGKFLRAATSPARIRDSAIETFFRQAPDDKLAQALAQTYITDPTKGLADLRAILPAHKRLYPTAIEVNNLIEALTNPARAVSVSSAGRLGARE